MSIKQLIILLIILLLVPIFLGKAPISQFADFFQHPSWSEFKSDFLVLYQADLDFYKALIWPWIDKLIEWFKDKIRAIL